MSAEVKRLVAEVEAARAELLERVADLDDEQGGHRPAEGEWSIAETVEHLFLAELGGVTKVWSAVSAFSAGVRWTEPNRNRGKSIEQVVAETWRPKEIAPGVAAPHLGGPLAAWRSAVRSLTPLLADLAARLEGEPMEEIVFPHALSGPLDARQRLAFLRFHMRRHLEQIDRIRASPGFPA